MSDNEIEDVSFLPGESLHRKAVYEPSIIQKLKLLLCSRTRLAVIATVGVLVIIVIGLIAALSKQHCPATVLESKQEGEATDKVQDYVATDGRPFPYRNIRLPSNIVPVHYKLFMRPNISQSLFTGKVEIVCHVKKETSFIVFHIKNLNITQLSLRLTETGNQYKIEEHQEYKTNEQVFVKLDTKLTRGSNVTLSVMFKGDLVKKLAGFYKSSYKTKSGETRYIATTHFEPTDARAAFPCLDEPDLKATFELSMIREKNQVALFNMPLKTSSNFKDGLIMDSFDTSVKMSTYLVAFVVCDYQKVTRQTERNVTVSVYAPADLIESADFAVKSATKIIDYYENFFGVNYPLPKQDLIAIPDFSAGAMENWGLITYRMTAILYDPKVATERNKQRVAEVIAHELAHQWFGNLVTMKWWDDLWLNEGFASFVQMIGSSIIEPQWRMEEQFVINSLLNAMYLDSLSSSHPINQPVDNPNQINELFDTISYDKGASIIRMLSNYLGRDIFSPGLTSYLQKYQFSNAVTTDLWTSLSGDSGQGKDVSSLMKTWTEQMGYPVINVRRHGNKVFLTQSRFLLYNNPNHTETPSPYGYKWQIPFTYTTSSNPQSVQKMLLKKTTETFQLASAPGWIKGNYLMYGYYRVNYEEDNWKKLSQQLFKKDHGGFSAPERAGLVDDAFMLARAGLLNYSIALDLTLYMVNEEDYLPWRALLENLAYLQVRVEKTPAFANYKAYLLTLMKRQLDSMVWEEDTGSRLLQKYLKAAILAKAVYLGHQDSVKKGQELFEAWKGNHSSINVNLKSVIYMAGIHYGTEADWQHMWEAYLVEHDATERRTLLSSLAYTHDANLLSRYLNFGLDEQYVKTQDTGRIIQSVCHSYTGMILGWRFMQQHWDTFYTRYGGSSFTMSSMIKAVTSRFDSLFDLNEVEMFFKDHDAGSGQRAVQQTLEKIQMNRDWTTKHEAMVIDWFQKHGKVK